VNKGFWWLLGGLLLIASLGGGSAVIALAAWQRSQNAQKWLPSLHQAESSFGLPQDLLARMAYQESGFDQDVINGTRASSAGALGLMQLLPRYFHTVRRPVPFSDEDTMDQINEAAGQVVGLYAQLSALAQSTGQNPWALVLAGYNAGAERVLEAGGIPDFPETQNYVAKILADVPSATAPA
jgi:peptidoglycan DL-endopeptidase CwlO